MPASKNHTRRSFLKKVSFTSLAITVSAQVPLLSLGSKLFAEEKNDHLTFLFQGDSITDGNRGRNNDANHIMGHGYAFSLASRIGARFPEKAFTFYNRGVSGNKISDLTERWQKDTLDIKPDVLSILVGVNDTDAAIRQKDAEATKMYEDGYSALLKQTKDLLPNCLLVLCEPFIAPVGRVKDSWNDWEKDMQKKQEVVQRLAKEYETVFVPLQKIFNNASRKTSAGYWIWDGIHPTVAGHELITQEWLKQVSKRLHFLKKLL